MSATIANNPTAAEYGKLESEFDWSKATDEEQLERMLLMKDLLVNCKGSTPIYDWHCVRVTTGERVFSTASDKLTSLNRRIRRFENQLARETAS